MPTVVVHRSTGQRYVLIGTGFAATETALPGMFLGNLSPEIETKACGMVAVCDGSGTIYWRNSTDFVVAEVDGHPPFQILGGPPQP
jgi:hypothetical protein